MGFIGGLMGAITEEATSRETIIALGESDIKDEELGWVFSSSK